MKTLRRLLRRATHGSRGAPRNDGDSRPGPAANVIARSSETGAWGDEAIS